MLRGWLNTWACLYCCLYFENTHVSLQIRSCKWFIHSFYAAFSVGSTRCLTTRRMEDFPWNKIIKINNKNFPKRQRKCPSAMWRHFLHAKENFNKLEFPGWKILLLRLLVNISPLLNKYCVSCDMWKIFMTSKIIFLEDLTSFADDRSKSNQTSNDLCIQ